jgi:hypothetical protein
MKIDLSGEDLIIVLGALEHYVAYARATNRRDGSRYENLSARLKASTAVGVVCPEASAQKRIKRQYTIPIKRAAAN